MIEFQVNYPEVGKTYMKRIGAYALISNEKNLLAIVKTNTGYFLPGGGVKENETFENCLQRECIEEIGFKIGENRDRHLFN